MSRIAHLIAETLQPHEKDALRQFGLGRGDAESPIPDNLTELRLIDTSWPVRKIQLTRLGKEVLGEIILATGQYMPPPSPNPQVLARVV